MEYAEMECEVGHKIKIKRDEGDYKKFLKDDNSGKAKMAEEQVINLELRFSEF